MRKYYPNMGTKIRSMLSVERSNGAIIQKALKLGLIYEDRNWSEYDEDLMKQYYPRIGIKVKYMLSVERSSATIKMKAKRMELIYEGNRWKEKDKKFLIENYGVLSIKKIAEILKRSEASINQMAKKLNIISSANELSLKDLYHEWSYQEIEILKKYYSLEGKKVANRLPYKNEKQCQNKAYKLKLIYIGNECNKTSKYKYVCWHKQRNKWMVMLYINGKQTYFGTFTDEAEAGRVAMEKAKEYGKAIQCDRTCPSYHDGKSIMVVF